MKHAYRAAAAAALLLSATPAWAHAHLKTATPAVDGTVAAAPTSVVIDFTEGVEPRFSTIAVTDAAGKRVDDGAAELDGAPTRLGVALKPIGAGLYTVTWHATAVDTHKTDGTFHFTVKP